MGGRLNLQDLFLNVIGVPFVYYQPPSTLTMNYPCILYSKSDVDVKRANNQLYTQRMRYSVTLIDQNPESEFFQKLLVLPYCRFNRHYTKDNLNHDVFNLYY